MRLHDANEAIRAELIRACGEDPVLAARTLLPHWFKRPIPWYARGIIAILLRRGDFLLNFAEEKWPEGSARWTKKSFAKLVRCFKFKVNPADPHSPEEPIFRPRYAEDGRTPVAVDMVLGTNVVLIIPRGFSKTTLINFTNIYKTLYRLTKFTVYVSEASQHAEDQCATVRRELSTNDRIISLFGNLKPDRSDEESWGAKSFETTTGVKFAARGRGAQIRGLNRFGDRPDTIVLDDVEDEESVSTDVQREKVIKWHTASVENALDRDEPNAAIYAIGTLLHPKALLPTLTNDINYTSIIFGAIDPEGELLWDDPAGMSAAALEKKRQAMAAKGQLYNFYLEYMSTHRDDARLNFRKEYIRYATHKPSDFLARSIHIDPAIGKSSKNDYTAIAVVGLKENGQKHICDFYARKGMPMSEQAEQFFKMRIEWDCTHHSCEAVAYQAALSQAIREMQAIKAKTYGMKAHFEVRDVWPSGRKIERVEGILQPLMASGYLTFQRIWPELEVMLLDWPNAELDGPDAIAGAIANLEPFAMLSYGDPEKLERDYAPPVEWEAPCVAGFGEVP